nr:hypothetical protein Q903MT_gene5000 [Picea sitchensis]
METKKMGALLGSPGEGEPRNLDSPSKVGWRCLGQRQLIPTGSNRFIPVL